MSRPTGYRTDAVVLRVVDFGETSQVVHLGTPEHGLVPAIAKGAFRAKGAFEGGMTLGVLGEAHLSPRRGAELELLKSFHVTDGLRGLRDDVDRFAAGEYVIGLLRDLMRPALPNEALFLAGVTALKAIAASPPESVPGWVAVFEARALAATGHRPHLATCVACGGDVTRGAGFSPSLGGLIHSTCDANGPRLRLSPSSLSALRRLYTARLPDLVSEPLDPSSLRSVREVHDAFLPYVLEHLPRARPVRRRDKYPHFRIGDSPNRAGD
jgi:DNA repair protein RecO (recombination protein O)